MALPVTLLTIPKARITNALSNWIVRMRSLRQPRWPRASDVCVCHHQLTPVISCYLRNSFRHTFTQAMQTARMELKLSQKEVAQKINEKPSVLQDYESGKAIPNAQILAKLERTLGVKLRGTLPSFPRPLLIDSFHLRTQVVTLGRSWRVRRSRNSFSP